MSGEDEGVDSQIDRLNLALQEVIEKINSRVPEVGSPTSKKSVQFWEDDFSIFSRPDSQPSSDFEEMQFDVERKLEELLLQLDRCNMRLEDFRSFENEKRPTTLRVHRTSYELLDEVNGLSKGKLDETNLGVSGELRTHYQEAPNPLEQEILVKDQELLVKERELAYAQEALEAERRKFQEHKKMHSREASKIKDNLMTLLKESHTTDSSSVHEEKSPESPVASLSALEKQREFLANSLSVDPTNEKTGLELDHVKTQISALKTERVLGTAYSAESPAFKSLPFRRRQVLPEPQCLPTRPHSLDEKYKNLLELKNQIEHTHKQQEHTKRFLQSRKAALKQKDIELARKEEKMLQSWMVVPNAVELVQKVQTALSSIHAEKQRLDREFEELELEKLEVLTLREKVSESRTRLQLLLKEQREDKQRMNNEKNEFEAMKSHLNSILPSIQTLLS